MKTTRWTPAVIAQWQQDNEAAARRILANPITATPLQLTWAKRLIDRIEPSSPERIVKSV